MRKCKNAKERAAFGRGAFAFSFLLFIASLNVFAATLTEYRGKIRKAETLTGALLANENSSSAERAKYEREIVANLRQSLPAAEKIEGQGANIETNNRWFQEKLDEFVKEANNPAKRRTILTEIKERLSAIEQKILELENPSDSSRSKDEDKRKLNEILKREEYQKPEEKEKSLIQRIWDAIVKWFQNEAPNPDVAPAAQGFQSASVVLQILLYAAIIGLDGFLLYRFLPFFATKFRNREKREKKDRVILGERIAADESADNLFSEAERLASEGNARAAIRKGYIALLCELSDRRIIGLSRHKTNRDYLRDVRKKRELYENMNGLTSNFERHWYGFEEAGEKDWEEFRSGYKKAVESR